MAQRPVPVVIREYARNLGLDPRAVEAVGFAESGLRRDAVGDRGTSFGPFQLHQGGALPRGRGAGWAGSDAGILYAMQQMSKVARGLSGQSAVDAIVRKFERPAAPGQEIVRAMRYYRGGGKLPAGASPVFGQAKQSGINKNQAILNYVTQSLGAYSSGSDEQPDMVSIMRSLQASNNELGDAATEALGTPAPTYTGGKGPKAMIALIREAQRRGLAVRENPFVDPVGSGHTRGSHHFQTYPGTNVGRAADISGNPAQMRNFFKFLEANRGRFGINDLFHDPMGYSYDRGRRWGRTIGGHGRHVHVSTV
jgi:hypothetical protein